MCKQKYARQHGKRANVNCPNKVTKVFITRPDSGTNRAWQSAADAEFMLPEEECTEHTEATKDTEKPVITLKGKAEMTLKLNEKYEEPGATATDKQDGDLTNQIKIEGKVDVTKEGTYTITYTVEDKAKNKATATRKVTIIKEDSNKNTDKNTNTNANTNTNTDSNETNTSTNTSNSATTN